MLKWRYITKVISFFIFLTSCEKRESPTEPDKPIDYLTKLSEGINDFGWELFEEDLIYRAAANIHINPATLYRTMGWFLYPSLRATT